MRYAACLTVSPHEEGLCEGYGSQSVTRINRVWDSAQTAQLQGLREKGERAKRAGHTRREHGPGTVSL